MEGQVAWVGVAWLVLPLCKASALVCICLALARNDLRTEGGMCFPGCGVKRPGVVFCDLTAASCRSDLFAKSVSSRRFACAVGILGLGEVTEPIVVGVGVEVHVSGLKCDGMVVASSPVASFNDACTCALTA